MLRWTRMCLKGRGQDSEQGGDSWKQVTKELVRHQLYCIVNVQNPSGEIWKQVWCWEKQVGKQQYKGRLGRHTEKLENLEDSKWNAIQITQCVWELTNTTSTKGSLSLGEHQRKRDWDVSSQSQCEAATGEADRKPKIHQESTFGDTKQYSPCMVRPHL